MLAYEAAGEAEIVRIAVEKESRRQGAGSHLMLKLENICEERKINKILLDVRESNAAARTCLLYTSPCHKASHPHPSTSKSKFL